MIAVPKRTSRSAQYSEGKRSTEKGRAQTADIEPATDSQPASDSPGLGDHYAARGGARHRPATHSPKDRIQASSRRTHPEQNARSDKRTCFWFRAPGVSSRRPAKVNPAQTRQSSVRSDEGPYLRQLHARASRVPPLRWLRRLSRYAKLVDLPTEQGYQTFAASDQRGRCRGACVSSKDR